MRASQIERRPRKSSIEAMTWDEFDVMLLDLSRLIFGVRSNGREGGSHSGRSRERNNPGGNRARKASV